MFIDLTNFKRMVPIGIFLSDSQVSKILGQVLHASAVVSLIQDNCPDTRAYTPGYEASAQPQPQETTPINSKFCPGVTPFPSPDVTRGPPGKKMCFPGFDTKFYLNLLDRHLCHHQSQRHKAFGP